MNDDLAEIQACLGKHKVAYACVLMLDGRTLDTDYSCRCMRLIKAEN